MTSLLGQKTERRTQEEQHLATSWGFKSGREKSKCFSISLLAGVSNRVSEIGMELRLSPKHLLFAGHEAEVYPSQKSRERRHCCHLTSKANRVPEARNVAHTFSKLQGQASNSVCLSCKSSNLPCCLPSFGCRPLIKITLGWGVKGLLAVAKEQLPQEWIRLLSRRTPPRALAGSAACLGTTFVRFQKHSAIKIYTVMQHKGV